MTYNRKFFQGLLVLSFAIAFTVGISTQQAFAQAAVYSSSHGAYDDVGELSVPLLDCNVDTGDIIALDVSKGATSNDYDTLIANLQGQGFTVREVNISTGIPICVVKLWIVPAASGFCLGGSYSAPEIASIVSWVNAGGALMLENEWLTCGALTSPITSAFGETTNNDDTGFGVTYTSGTNYNPANPAALWTGVASWQEFDGTTYAASTDAVATDGIFPAGKPVEIAKEVGDGCVLITGDYDWNTDTFIASSDNAELGLNSFVHLNQCIAPAVGGMFLPVDATALFVAGLTANAFWMIPAIAGITGTGIYFTKSRRTEEN